MTSLVSYHARGEPALESISSGGDLIAARIRHRPCDTCICSGDLNLHKWVSRVRNDQTGAHSYGPRVNGMHCFFRPGFIHAGCDTGANSSRATDSSDPSRNAARTGNELHATSVFD